MSKIPYTPDGGHISTTHKRLDSNTRAGGGTSTSPPNSHTYRPDGKTKAGKARNNPSPKTPRNWNLTGGTRSGKR